MKYTCLFTLLKFLVLHNYLPANFLEPIRVEAEVASPAGFSALAFIFICTGTLPISKAITILERKCYRAGTIKDKRQTSMKHGILKGNRVDLI